MQYLASPYSHCNSLVREKRIRSAARIAGILFDRGEFVIPAIPLGHEMASWTKEKGDDWKTWAEFDKELIRRCDGVIVLCIDGWRESIGVKAEIKFAKSIGKPVRYIDEQARTLEGMEA